MPPHVHESSWEIVGLLSVGGSFLREPTADEHARAHEGQLALEQGLVAEPIASGLTQRIAPGARHGFAAAGDVPTVAVQLYVPPGPEQRFKELAERFAVRR